MAQRQQALLRQFKLEKFKQAKWGNQSESYFLQRKTRLDRVIYSLLRVKEPALAQELYFRLDGGENTFNELATQYSQGPEANTGGLIGPADIGSCHPQIGQLLRVSQPGQLWSPCRVEEWWVVVRHEKFLPAQMDDAMQRRMVDELFGAWLQEQSQQVGILDVSNSSAGSAQKSLWETPA
jgi:parvulin-like peptidyl-prolyl isomerase